jgi:hypothetical protein
MTPTRLLTTLMALSLASGFSAEARADDAARGAAAVAPEPVRSEPVPAGDEEVESFDEGGSGATEEEPEWENVPVERRGGFAFGLSLGVGFGAANGYPADSRKIGFERYYTETGIGLDTAGSIWLGGALTDWLNFGAGMGNTNLLAEGTESPAPTVFFHLDVFPLYEVDESLRDLGMMLEAGLGFAQTRDTATDEELIQAPGASYVAAGAFWEGLELWKLRSGPYLAGQMMFSDTLRRPSLLAGFRSTFYWDP